MTIMAAEKTGVVTTVISGLLGTALGITITYSTGVASNRTEIVRLATQVQNLTNTITMNMTDRYRGADAARDFRHVDEKIIEIVAHNKEMEAELRNHLGTHRTNQ